MKRRWLVAAALLFGLVALLSWLDEPEPVSTGKQLEFRRYPTPEERQVMEARRTLAPLPPPPGDPALETERRDPLLVALPRSAGTLLVLEAKTFFDMPIGRMLLRCLKNDAAEMADQGLDPKRIERVAFARSGPDEQVMAISGKFADQPLPSVAADSAQPYGEKGKLFLRAADGSASHKATALWDNQLLLIGDRIEDLEGAIDRLEGRVPGEPAVDGNEAYGEAYGRLGAEALEALAPEPIREQLEGADLSVDFHLDASEDALLMLDATGEPDTAPDIGQTLAALLAARRVQAVAEGDRRLAELLDLYAVRVNEGGFELEAAFPLDYVRTILGDCASEAADAGAGD